MLQNEENDFEIPCGFEPGIVSEWLTAQPLKFNENARKKWHLSWTEKCKTPLRGRNVQSHVPPLFPRTL